MKWWGITERSKSCLGNVQSCFFAHRSHTGVTSSLPARPQAFSSCHWIVQNGNFCSRFSSWIESSFGELSPAAPLPPTDPPPGGHIDCHLSARVDTMGGRMGLLSRILSSSFIVLVLSFGTSCNTMTAGVIYCQLLLLLLLLLLFVVYLMTLSAAQTIYQGWPQRSSQATCGSHISLVQLVLVNKTGNRMLRTRCFVWFNIILEET
jgi:hypothetical protein